MLDPRIKVRTSARQILPQLFLRKISNRVWLGRPFIILILIFNPLLQRLRLLSRISDGSRIAWSAPKGTAAKSQNLLESSRCFGENHGGPEISDVEITHESGTVYTHFAADALIVRQSE
jgi:hypothetical protein